MPNRERMVLKHRLAMQAGSDSAEIMIYSEIASPGWKWSMDDKTAADFDREIKKALENGAKKLRIRINSPGGDVNQAVAMRGMLMNAGFEEIEVAIEGMCASAATLFSTLPDVHVTMLEGSEFMIHNPMTGCWGQAWELESAATRLRNTEKEVRAMYAKRSGQDDAQIRAWMDAETWFTAGQARDAGFVDEIIAAEPMIACASPALMAAMRAMYAHIPDTIREEAEDSISNGNPPESSAGAPTEHNDHHEEERQVELNQATMENIREENPQLYESIMQAGQNAERERMQQIDDMTEPGYEEMAAEAKKNGTSPMDFMKQVAAAKRDKKAAEQQRGTQFMASRQQETAPAAAVTGGAAEDGKAMTEDEEIEAHAKKVAAFAASMRAGNSGSMF
ncbi:MAG: Clp protease ClpP [Clostridia bacterium]|nr:Clp protease ClpP [Clostridia bacterium]